MARSSPSSSKTRAECLHLQVRDVPLGQPVLGGHRAWPARSRPGAARARRPSPRSPPRRGCARSSVRIPQSRPSTVATTVGWGVRRFHVVGHRVGEAEPTGAGWPGPPRTPCRPQLVLHPQCQTCSLGDDDGAARLPSRGRAAVACRSCRWAGGASRCSSKSMVLGALNLARWLAQNTRSPGGQPRQPTPSAGCSRPSPVRPSPRRGCRRRRRRPPWGVTKDALDLGRVDVDPAGDDHVDLAVTQEEVAVLVDHPTSPTVKKAPMRSFRSSPCRRGTRSRPTHRHVDRPDDVGLGDPFSSSSNTAISLIGHGFSTVPGFCSHSSPPTTVRPPSLPP